MVFGDSARSDTECGVTKTAVALATIVVVGTIACASILLDGAPNGDSVQIDLAWLQRFAAQVLQGDLYPRWLMDMSHGAGSPAFYYYAPMPFYLASIPVLLAPGAKLTVQLACGEWLLIVLSGIAFFRYAYGRFATATAVFCSALYMILPYHFEIDLWRRQDLGELANYVWVPLLFHYIDEILHDRRGVIGFAIIYALMIGSHLPTTLLISIGVCAYVLTHTLAARAYSAIPRLLSGLGIGILLSAIYWVPALFSEAYVRIDTLWSPFFDFHLWLFPITRLLELDPTVVHFVRRLFFGIGVSAVIFSISWLLSIYDRDRTTTRAQIAQAIVVGTACFLMCSCSAGVWEIAPELWKVQFPWRFAIVVDFFAAVALLRLVESLCRHWDVLSAAAVAALLGLTAWSLLTADLEGYLDGSTEKTKVEIRDSEVRDGLDVMEYTPRWNHSEAHNYANVEDASLVMAGMNKVVYAEANGSVNVLQWKPRKIQLSVRLQSPTRVTVRQFYFPNWRAKIQGIKELKVIHRQDNGLLAIEMPPGDYVVDLRLELLAEERVGTALSMLGVLVLLGGKVHFQGGLRVLGNIRRSAFSS